MASRHSWVTQNNHATQKHRRDQIVVWTGDFVFVAAKVTLEVTLACTSTFTESKARRSLSIGDFPKGFRRKRNGKTATACSRATLAASLPCARLRSLPAAQHHLTIPSTLARQRTEIEAFDFRRRHRSGRRAGAPYRDLRPLLSRMRRHESGARRGRSWPQPRGVDRRATQHQDCGPKRTRLRSMLSDLVASGSSKSDRRWASDIQRSEASCWADWVTTWSAANSRLGFIACAGTHATPSYRRY